METWSQRFSRIRLLVVIALLALLAPATPSLADTNAGYDVKFSGVIDVVPGTEGAPWTIAGYQVTVNATTQVLLTKGEAASPGMWADVTARRLDDGKLLAQRIAVMPPEVRLKGPLTDKPADIGAWTVAGQTIWVTAETVVSQRSGPIEVGRWLEVHAVEQPAGNLTAVRVRSMEEAELVEVFGAIQRHGVAEWVLSTIPVTASAETMIVGEPHIGLLAHAAAEMADDSTLSARVLRVEWQEPSNRRMHHPIQWTGIIEALPAEGLEGLWTVSGRTVEVRESTQIVQVKGAVQVGATVHVTGWEEADRIVAIQVTVLTSPSGSGRVFYLHGRIEALPERGLYGTWTIAGQQVRVTRQTRIHGEEHVRLGAPVEAGGLQYRDGVRVLTWLRVRDMAGPGPGPKP